MSDIAIRVEHLSKQYRLGGRLAGYRTFREAMLKALAAPVRWMRGERKTIETFWALDDVSFEIKQGEVLGIIGRNGAGKSTLLKILSRITKPTKGRVDLYGRVASLLEVGTGFHPELSGRDNIYLNAAILGMNRAEINRKFDEIVDFAEVEKFLDTPVKYYSSGMYVRLAFSVAAHLEPEILIVDEVLAVGDAEFQKKCLGKMDDVAHEGRTVLFVSHNMAAIRKLCTNGILLEHGSIVKSGNIDVVVEAYSGDNTATQEFEPFRIAALGVEIQRITLNENAGGMILPFKPLSINIDILAEKEVSGIGLQVTIANDAVDGILFSSNTKQTKDMDIRLIKGMNKITCSINSLNICSGRYQLGFAIDQPNVSWYYYDLNILGFDVQEAMYGHWTTLPIYNRFYLDHEWIISQKKHS